MCNHDVIAKECKYILKSLQEKSVPEGHVLVYLASYQHLLQGGGHLSAKQLINGSMFIMVACPLSHLETKVYLSPQEVYYGTQLV